MTVEELILRFWVARMTMQRRMAAALEAAWDRTAGPSDAEERAWLVLALPIVLGAQRAMVRLTEAHQRRVLTEVLGRPIPARPLNADLFIGRNVRGVEPQEVYTRSIISVRRALAQDRPYREGFDGGRGRAVQAAETDLAKIHYEVSDVVLLQPDLYEQAGDRIVGQRRVLSPPSCGMCASDAGTVYPPGKKIRLHPRCDCTAAPVTARSDPGAQMNADKPGGVPIEEHDHGELGPIITDARFNYRETGDLKASPREGQGATRDGRAPE